MGMFTQKPQEPSAWAALPGEPLDRDDDLLPAPAADPLGLGLGTTGGTSVSVDVTGAASVAVSPLPAEDAEES